jgi:GNAT superfamily N-acetyltransferase
MIRKLRRAAHRALAAVFIVRTNVIQVNDLDRYTPDNSAPDRRHSIQRISYGDLDRIRSEYGPTIEERFRERLPASDGYQVIIDGTTAGWQWVAKHSRPREGAHPFFYEIRPPEGCAYVYDAFTAPAARRGGVMQALFSHVLAELKQQGIRCVYFTHAANNAAMSRIAASNGFSVAGLLRYRRLLWWEHQDIEDLEKVCQ